MKCDPSGTSSWYLNGVYYTYEDTAEDRYRKEANLPPVSYLKACNAQFVHCSPSYYENANAASTTVGGAGMSVSVGWGLDVGFSGYYVEDGEFQATISTLGIGGGLGASTGFGAIVHSDIEHVWDLGGWGVSIGGTLGFISYEYNYGAGGGFGIISPGTELGLEFHALITYTVVEGVWGH